MGYNILVNENLFYLLNGFAGKSAFGDSAIYFFAEIFPWLLVLGLIAFIFFAKNKKDVSKFVAISILCALLSWFVISFFKYNIHTPRPFETLNIRPVFFTEQGDSMPSGHSAFVGALAVAVYLQRKRLGWFFILGALVVGIARIMAGVHWPIDILVGLVAGGVLSWLIYYLLNKLFAKLKTV